MGSCPFKPIRANFDQTAQVILPFRESGQRRSRENEVNTFSCRMAR